MSAQSDYELAQSMGDHTAETQRLYALCLGQRGMQLDQSGDLVGADSFYTAAIGIAPTESTLFNRAFLRQRTGRMEEAIQGFKAVLAVNPQQAQAAAAAGTLLVQGGRYDEAIPLLGLAAQLTPNQADVNYNAGE